MPSSSPGESAGFSTDFGAFGEAGPAAVVDSSGAHTLESTANVNQAASGTAGGFVADFDDFEAAPAAAAPVARSAEGFNAGFDDFEAAPAVATPVAETAGGFAADFGDFDAAPAVTAPVAESAQGFAADFGDSEAVSATA